MPVQTQQKYLGDWLKLEAENQFSRDIVTVLAGSGAVRELLTGMVLGRITKGIATSAVVAGNTGNGTITANPTVGQAAKPGVYQLVCIEPAANAGKFTVEDPETWDRTWTAEAPLAKTEGPIFEFACHETNYGIANILAGARTEDKQKAEQAKKGSN